jgi:hypothetical protein
VEDEGKVKGMDVAWRTDKKCTCDERCEQRGTGQTAEIFTSLFLDKKTNMCMCKVAGEIHMDSCSCPNLTVALVSGYSYSYSKRDDYLPV